jgi:nucleotide-binding universal stress UspA family protein
MALETVLLAVGPGDAEEGRWERLAEEAVDIAGPSGANVVLAHVFTDDEYDTALDQLEFDTTADEVSANDVARRHTTVRDIGAVLEEADIDYDVRGSKGEHGNAIVSLAKETGADLVIVGGRKRSPAGKAVFGSTAQEVMLESPCPVTFVRADTS